MVDSDEVQRKLERGRAAIVASLRNLADQLERLALPDATEAMVWLSSRLEDLERDAGLVFRRS
jgi:hypothetical protein